MRYLLIHQVRVIIRKGLERLLIWLSMPIHQVRVIIRKGLEKLHIWPPMPIHQVLVVIRKILEKLHIGLPIGFILVVFLSKVLKAIDWVKFMKEITTEIPPIEFVFVIIAILALILGPLIKYRFKIYLRKVASVEIAKPSTFNYNDSMDSQEIKEEIKNQKFNIDRQEIEEEFKNQKFNSVFVNNRNQPDQQLSNAELRQQYNDRIEQLTNLAEEVFPRGEGKHGISYAESRDERRDAFRLWTRFNPDTAKIIYYNEKPIGMSLMLRLSKDAYTRYKNGKLRSWAIEERDLVKTDEKDTPYIFFQYIYCKRGRNSDPSKYMCWVFLNHLSIFWKSSGHEPVLIAPRRTEMGQVNAERLGFERCGQDLGFPLYELDLRHPDELNGEGQEVHRLLKQLINTQD